MEKQAYPLCHSNLKGMMFCRLMWADDEHLRSLTMSGID